MDPDPVHFAPSGFRIDAGGFSIEPGRLDITAGGFDPDPADRRLELADMTCVPAD